MLPKDRKLARFAFHRRGAMSRFLWVSCRTSGTMREQHSASLANHAEGRRVGASGLQRAVAGRVPPRRRGHMRNFPLPPRVARAP
jgi:hypothetical protein